MRMSDLSSDVCSSDLAHDVAMGLTVEVHVVGEAAAPGDEADILLAPHRLADAELLDAVHWRILAFRDPRALSGSPRSARMIDKIGRASCRESVCQSV